MAGLLTTPALARGFAAGGMEFFATTGGCTAATACGLAVLEVIREERLQENAAAVGAHCLERLRELQVGGSGQRAGCKSAPAALQAAGCEAGVCAGQPLRVLSSI